MLSAVRIVTVNNLTSFLNVIQTKQDESVSSVITQLFACVKVNNLNNCHKLFIVCRRYLCATVHSLSYYAKQPHTMGYYPTVCIETINNNSSVIW